MREPRNSWPGTRSEGTRPAPNGILASPWLTKKIQIIRFNSNAPMHAVFLRCASCRSGRGHSLGAYQQGHMRGDASTRDLPPVLATNPYSTRGAIVRGRLGLGAFAGGLRRRPERALQRVWRPACGDPQGAVAISWTARATHIVSVAENVPLHMTGSHGFAKSRPPAGRAGGGQGTPSEPIMGRPYVGIAGVVNRDIFGRGCSRRRRVPCGAGP